MKNRYRDFFTYKFNIESFHSMWFKRMLQAHVSGEKSPIFEKIVDGEKEIIDENAESTNTL